MLGHRFFPFQNASSLDPSIDFFSPSLHPSPLVGKESV